jgi:hypothetical protein
MKILIIDRVGFQLQARKTLIENESSDWKVETISSFEELQNCFETGKYTLIIIDHTIENGQACIDYILNIHPMQPILIVSDAPHCVLARCPDCVANHNMRRLNNPTPIHNIVRMVRSFDTYSCDHYQP